MKTSLLTLTMLSLTALFLAACGGARPHGDAPCHEGAPKAEQPCDKPCDKPCDGEAKAAHHADHAMPCDPAKCPRAVAGTTVAAEDMADGGSLVFTTTGDVAEVQKRVAGLAAAHADMAAPGCKCEACKCGECKCGADHIPSTVTVENFDKGAKLVFKPTKAEDLTKLQAMLKAHAEKANKPCDCPEHGKAGAAGSQPTAGSQPVAPASAP